MRRTIAPRLHFQDLAVLRSTELDLLVGHGRYHLTAQSQPRPSLLGLESCELLLHSLREGPMASNDNPEGLNRINACLEQLDFLGLDLTAFESCLLSLVQVDHHRIILGFWEVRTYHSRLDAPSVDNLVVL